MSAKVCHIDVNFLVDTGSAIDALNVTTYRNMPNPPELHAPFYTKVYGNKCTDRSIGSV